MESWMSDQMWLGNPKATCLLDLRMYDSKPHTILSLHMKPEKNPQDISVYFFVVLCLVWAPRA